MLRTTTPDLRRRRTRTGERFRLSRSQLLAGSIAIASIEVAMPLLLGINSIAFAKPLQPLAPRPCRTDRRVMGDCFEVHGRLSFGSGNPSLRMWRVGTKRYLGVWDDEEPIVPANLAAVLQPPDAVWRTVFGDFVVCPFTKERPGWMRMVCIEAARHIVIRDDRHPD